MNNVFSISLSFSCLLFLAACVLEESSGSERDPEPPGLSDAFFPMAVENTWNYVMISGSYDGSTDDHESFFRIEVAGHQATPSGDIWIIQEKYRVDFGIEEWTGFSRAWKLENDTVYEAGLYFGDTVWYARYAGMARSWRASASVSALSRAASPPGMAGVNVEPLNEPFMTPAGTFENCVTNTDPHYGAIVSVICPGVGLVGQNVESDYPLLLQSYELME
jgi:hypothetical protein